MPDRNPQPGGERSDHWSEDLHPDFLAGQNIGLAGPRPELHGPSAFDLKEAHEALEGFSDEELRQIPILPSGSRLEQGATYLDLRDPRRAEFTAMGGQEAGRDNWYVPKKSVDYQLWNRLIGVDNPERLGQADER